MVRAFFVLAMFMWATAANAQTVMKFGGGVGEVTIPSHYARASGKTPGLVVVSTPEGNVRLYFDLHRLDGAQAETYLRDLAKANGGQIRKRGDKLVLFQPGPHGSEDGRMMLRLHWQIGFGETLVAMSAYVPAEARDAADVKRFTAGDLDAIVDSLRRVGS